MAAVQRLSTPEIIRLSRDVFNKLSSQHHIELSTIHKFLDSARFDLSDSEIKDVELAVLLIASTHEASNNHFDETKRLLNLCGFLSSYNGNTVQRIVHYFTKGLQQRIARETGIIPSETFYLIEPIEKALDPVFIACWLQIPSIRVSQFAAIQVVIDSLDSAKKVHFIALSIRSGVQCPILMQALANRPECPVELLKITAVGISETKQHIDKIGKTLTCLAETLSLPFSFSSFDIGEIKDFKKEKFGISEDEVVAVLSLNTLRNIRVFPACWKSFPKFLMNLNPRVLVVVEPEEIYDSPVFIDRFYVALLSYSSFFDCIEAFLSKEAQNRISFEAVMGQEIDHILAAKEEDMLNRNTNIDTWREYFTGFGMVETEVSLSSFDQANLLVKNSASEELCLLERNGKCLITGWKGTPYLSVSAWKFEPGKSKAGLVGRKVT